MSTSEAAPPPRLAADKTVIPPPQRAGSKISTSHDGMGYAVACMTIRLQTSKTLCHTQPAMRAKEPTIGPHCHSAIITTARGWMAHFFLL